MGLGHFTDDFKRDAVAQITERGLPRCRGVEAARREPALTLRLEAEVLEATSFAQR
mgnify:CR=1 FL=1